MIRRWCLLPLLALLAACGGGDSSAEVRRAPAAADTVAAAPAPAPALAPSQGRVLDHPEGGFSVFWPAGCDQIKQRESTGSTGLAEREVIFSCIRDDVSFSVRCLKMAHDAEGNPAHPRFVVSLIESQLNRKSMRTVRQRPLEAAQVQGVDVHAEGRDSRQRAWFRGLLVGHDVYLLLAIGEAPDLFERAEVQDFFYSFQLGES